MLQVKVTAPHSRLLRRRETFDPINPLPMLSKRYPHLWPARELPARRTMFVNAGMKRILINPAITELLPGYLERRVADVEHLKALILDGDFDAIQRLGHKLGGNGTMFGFDVISSAGRALETAAQDRDVPGIHKHTIELFEYLASLEICVEGEV